MKKELREVLDAASKRCAERPDYLLSPDVKTELERLREERASAHPHWTPELAARVAAIEAEREQSPKRALLGTVPCTEEVLKREGRRKVPTPCTERMSVYANDQRARGWLRAE